MRNICCGEGPHFLTSNPVDGQPFRGESLKNHVLMGCCELVLSGPTQSLFLTCVLPQGTNIDLWQNEKNAV